MHKIYISSKDTNARLQEIDLNDIKSNDDCNDIIYINKNKTITGMLLGVIICIILLLMLIIYFIISRRN